MTIARLAAAVTLILSGAALADSPQTITNEPEQPAPLLVPAVQKVREAAARLGDSVAPHERLGLTPIDPAPRGGVGVAVGDVNGDGRAGSGRPMESFSLNFEKIEARGGNEATTVGGSRTESGSEVAPKGMKSLQNGSAPGHTAGNFPQGQMTARKSGADAGIPPVMPSAPAEPRYGPIMIRKEVDLATPQRGASLPFAPAGRPDIVAPVGPGGGPAPAPTRR